MLIPHTAADTSIGEAASRGDASALSAMLVDLENERAKQTKSRQLAIYRQRSQAQSQGAVTLPRLIPRLASFAWQNAATSWRTLLEDLVMHCKGHGLAEFTGTKLIIELVMGGLLPRLLSRVESSSFDSSRIEPITILRPSFHTCHTQAARGGRHCLGSGFRDIAHRRRCIP